MSNRREFLKKTIAGTVALFLPTTANAQKTTPIWELENTPDWMFQIKTLDGQPLTLKRFYMEVAPEGMCLDFCDIPYSEIEYVLRSFKELCRRHPPPPVRLLSLDEVRATYPDLTLEGAYRFMEIQERHRYS